MCFSLNKNNGPTGFENLQDFQPAGYFEIRVMNNRCVRRVFHIKTRLLKSCRTRQTFSEALLITF